MPPRKSHIPKFRTATASLRKAKKVADRHVHDFALAEAERFRLRIKEQNFASFARIPLSPITLKRKETLHLDLRTMIATGHYVDSIKVLRWVDGKMIRYKVGFTDAARAVDADGRRTKLLLNDLAAIQEHGSAAQHIPARPHWGPHLRDMHQRATVVVSAIQNAVKEGG